MAQFYPLLRQLHDSLSDVAMGVGLVMLAWGIYVGLIRHGDVTRRFRLGVYAVTALMIVQALMGLAMAAVGGRPYEEVHWIYGAGAVLALPFFIYVEVTAKKRPAMGSYIWGFGLMVAIIVRAMMTGGAG
jgi:heme A synthase